MSTHAHIRCPGTRASILYNVGPASATRYGLARQNAFVRRFRIAAFATSRPLTRPNVHSPTHQVGTRGENATEYHDNDFDWEILRDDGREAVRRQRLEHAQVGAETATATSTSTSTSTDVPCTNEWEEFHAQHSLGRFFKEKRYLPIEFPQLRAKGVVVGEIGCGCGSALIPVLRDNETATAVACDVSSTAIAVFRDAAMPGAGIDPDRVELSVHDFPVTSPFGPETLDIAMVIFTLSAYHPEDMEAVVAGVKRGLRTGGLVLNARKTCARFSHSLTRTARCALRARSLARLVLLRDYGMYDMAQRRFHGSHLVDPDHLVYRRLDGTLSHFFDIDALKALFETAGFNTVEAKYCTVALRNKKKGNTMHRVFVHGVFQKLDDSSLMDELSDDVKAGLRFHVVGNDDDDDDV